ncbi:MAG: hypothetical protein Q9196_004293 [Gyalolechia fulgens]
MVHAEASNFPANLSKRDVYTRLLTLAEALFEGERNWVAEPLPAQGFLNIMELTRFMA